MRPRKRDWKRSGRHEQHFESSFNQGDLPRKIKGRKAAFIGLKKGSYMSIIDGIKGASKGVKRVRAIREANPEVAKPSCDGQMYCKACGTQALPTTVTPGSILIEAVLWLCFLIPGVIYSLWRHNKRHEVCPKCGSDALIPHDSPIGISEKRERQQ